MRTYYRRSIWGTVLVFLVGIVAVAYLAKVVYEWLVPLLPLVGGVILLIVFVMVGFRRRY